MVSGKVARANAIRAEPLNPFIAIAAGALVRALELLSLRGAPTLFKLLSRSTRLGEIRATIRLATGELITFPAFDAYWCRHLWANASYEPEVEQIFRRIGKGRVLIDCGANIGYWSIRARKFGFKRVIAIEANRELLPILQQNFDLNAIPGTVFHAAVYHASGESLFLDHTEAHAQAGIGERGMPVESLALADAVQNNPIDAEFVVKLDVEGAEVAALKGAEGISNAVFVYEDFACRDMIVTRYLLNQGMGVFGVTAAGISTQINSVQEAFTFSAQTAAANGPSNLLACQAGRAAQMQWELAQ